jgi:hypothetical protein
MTRDDIIRLGRESQRERFSDGGYWFSMEVRDLEHFADLVAAEKDKEIERLRAVLKKLEYSFDGDIKRYPDEHEVETALQRSNFDDPRRKTRSVNY